jgi:hypothetical protein
MRQPVVSSETARIAPLALFTQVVTFPADCVAAIADAGQAGPATTIMSAAPAVMLPTRRRRDAAAARRADR